MKILFILLMLPISANAMNCSNCLQDIKGIGIVDSCSPFKVCCEYQVNIVYKDSTFTYETLDTFKRAAQFIEYRRSINKFILWADIEETCSYKIVTK